MPPRVQLPALIVSRLAPSASTSTIAASIQELTGWSSGSPTWRPHWTRDPCPTVKQADYR